MEEDIKVLEKYVEKDIPCNSCKYCAERPKVAGALRNLINRNKQLEEIEKEHKKENRELLSLLNEIREVLNRYKYTELGNYEKIINFYKELQELLEEGDDK